MVDNNDVDDVLLYSSSRGNSVPRVGRRLRRAAAHLLPLRQQGSLLPLLSASLIAVQRTYTTLVREAQQLQQAQ